MEQNFNFYNAVQQEFNSRRRATVWEDTNSGRNENNIVLRHKMSIKTLDHISKPNIQDGGQVRGSVYDRYYILLSCFRVQFILKTLQPGF